VRYVVNRVLEQVRSCYPHLQPSPLPRTLARVSLTYGIHIFKWWGWECAVNTVCVCVLYMEKSRVLWKRKSVIYVFARHFLSKATCIYSQTHKIQAVFGNITCDLGVATGNELQDFFSN